MSHGKGQPPTPDQTVSDLDPVPGEDPAQGAPGDTLEGPTDAAARVPPTLPLLDAVPDGPGWSLDERSGEHQKPPSRPPGRLDVLAAEPSKPRARRLPRPEADAFEGGRSEPALKPIARSAVAAAEDSTLWFWVAVGVLALVAVVVVFF